MTPMRATWCAVALAAASATVSAHHSLSAVYDEGRRVTLEGAVHEFRLVNPHPWVELTVSAGAERGQWRLEMDNLFELSAIGVKADTFKSGDRLVVSGNPARDQSKGLYVRQLDRPADGLRYEQIGFTPRIRTIR